MALCCHVNYIYVAADVFMCVFYEIISPYVFHRLFQHQVWSWTDIFIFGFCLYDLYFVLIGLIRTSRKYSRESFPVHFWILAFMKVNIFLCSSADEFSSDNWKENRLRIKLQFSRKQIPLAKRLIWRFERCHLLRLRELKRDRFWKIKVSRNPLGDDKAKYQLWLHFPFGNMNRKRT